MTVEKIAAIKAKRLAKKRATIKADEDLGRAGVSTLAVLLPACVPILSLVSRWLVFIFIPCVQLPANFCNVPCWPLILFYRIFWMRLLVQCWRRKGCTEQEQRCSRVLERLLLQLLSANLFNLCSWQHFFLAWFFLCSLHVPILFVSVPVPWCC